MLAAARYDAILAAVREHGVVRLSDLVDRLGVTPVTVRRDVTRLADRGLVARVHGGVAIPRRVTRDHTPPRSVIGPIAPGAVIGMVVPSVEYYWPKVIQGAQGAVSTAGGRLIFRGSSYDTADDRAQITNLLDRGVQAVLAAPNIDGKASAELLRWLGGLPVPVILLERRPPAELEMLPLDAVFSDHALGVGLAVRHLTTMGRRRIGLITTRPSVTSDALHMGWAHTVRALGLDVDGVPHMDIPSYGAPGWVAHYDQVIDQLLDAEVGGIVVHADREAIGIVHRAQERGLRIPEDLAVVSYDDEVAAACDPPLTALRPEKYRLGVLAADLALARIAEDPDRPVHRVTLWPSLVVRQSCGARAD